MATVAFISRFILGLYTETVSAGIREMGSGCFEILDKLRLGRAVLFCGFWEAQTRDEASKRQREVMEILIFIQYGFGLVIGQSYNKFG